MTGEDVAAGSLTVAILCGGRGARLGPMTELVPKPMVRVQGRPMLDHIIDFFESKGVRRFTLCAGYRADVIRAHFSETARDSEIAISEAGEGASMLERIWALREQAFEHVLIAYGDTFIDLDLDDLLAQHRAAGAPVTIVTAEITSPFGLVQLDGAAKVASFREKPVMRYYIGCALFDRAAFTEIAEPMLAKPDGEGLVAFYQHLIEKGRLSAYLHTGLQMTFNTQDEHRRVETEIGRFHTYRETA